MPVLNRTDTMTSLPIYESRTGTPIGDRKEFDVELRDFRDPQRPVPSRMGTQNSYSSINSNAPLMADAGGIGGRASPAPALPLLNRSVSNFSISERISTAQSMHSQYSHAGPPQRPGTAQSMNSQYNRQGPPRRMPTPLARQHSQEDYYGQVVHPQEMYTAPQSYNTRPMVSPIQESYSQIDHRNPSPVDLYSSPTDYNIPSLPRLNTNQSYSAFQRPSPQISASIHPIGASEHATELPAHQPTIPFGISEMPATILIQQSFGTEIPAPGSTSRLCYTESANGCEHSSSAPSQYPQAGRASPAPSYLNRSFQQPQQHRSDSNHMASASQTSNISHTSNTSNPYRNMTDPTGRQYQPHGGPWRGNTPPTQQSESLHTLVSNSQMPLSGQSRSGTPVNASDRYAQHHVANPYVNSYRS